MRTDFRIVEIDETKYWIEDFLKEIGSGKVYGVYIFDKNQVTCLCSPEPNYWLRHLYFTTENQMSEENQMIFDHECYNGDGVDNYYLCSGIDKLKSVEVDMNFEYDENSENKDVIDDEEETYESKFEEVYEYCRCNHYI